MILKDIDRCKNCGDQIHLNQFDHIWRHSDSWRRCYLNPRSQAEPKTPDNVELGGAHD